MYNIIQLVFLVIIFTCLDKRECCNECGRKLYEPPSNIKFPYGDENQLNTDVSENDTNTILCEDRPPLKPKQGRCPFPPEDPRDMPLTHPYVRCPVFPELPPGNVPLGEPVPPPIVQCRNCDLKLTNDDSAVLLKCIGCYDLPSTERAANFTVKDILYKVFFIEITNYTSVNVQGKENF